MKESQIIKTISWNDGSLYVTLHNIKKVYEYKEVPEQVYLDFMNADSLGKYFVAHVKGKYEEESYPEVTYTHNDPYPFPTTKPTEGYKINKPRPWDYPVKEPMLEEFSLDTDLTEEEVQELLDAINDPSNDGMDGATT
jgi:hypothetical protein